MEHILSIYDTLEIIQDSPLTDLIEFKERYLFLQENFSTLTWPSFGVEPPVSFTTLPLTHFAIFDYNGVVVNHEYPSTDVMYDYMKWFYNLAAVHGFDVPDFIFYKGDLDIIHFDPNLTKSQLENHPWDFRNIYNQIVTYIQNKLPNIFQKMFRIYQLNNNTYYNYDSGTKVYIPQLPVASILETNVGKRTNSNEKSFVTNFGSYGFPENKQYVSLFPCKNIDINQSPIYYNNVIPCIPCAIARSKTHTFTYTTDPGLTDPNSILTLADYQTYFDYINDDSDITHVTTAQSLNLKNFTSINYNLLEHYTYNQYQYNVDITITKVYQFLLIPLHGGSLKSTYGFQPGTQELKIYLGTGTDDITVIQKDSSLTVDYAIFNSDELSKLRQKLGETSSYQSFNLGSITGPYYHRTDFDKSLYSASLALSYTNLGVIDLTGPLSYAKRAYTISLPDTFYTDTGLYLVIRLKPSTFINPGPSNFPTNPKDLNTYSGTLPVTKSLGGPIIKDNTGTPIGANDYLVKQVIEHNNDSGLDLVSDYYNVSSVLFYLSASNQSYCPIEDNCDEIS